MCEAYYIGRPGKLLPRYQLQILAGFFFVLSQASKSCGHSCVKSVRNAMLNERGSVLVTHFVGD